MTATEMGCSLQNALVAPNAQGAGTGTPISMKERDLWGLFGRPRSASFPKFLPLCSSQKLHVPWSHANWLPTWFSQWEAWTGDLKAEGRENSFPSLSASTCVFWTRGCKPSVVATRPGSLTALQSGVCQVSFAVSSFGTSIFSSSGFLFVNGEVPLCFLGSSVTMWPTFYIKIFFFYLNFLARFLFSGLDSDTDNGHFCHTPQVPWKFFQYYFLLNLWSCCAEYL